MWDDRPAPLGDLSDGSDTYGSCLRTYAVIGCQGHGVTIASQSPVSGRSGERVPPVVGYNGRQRHSQDEYRSPVSSLLAAERVVVYDDDNKGVTRSHGMLDSQPFEHPRVSSGNQ